MATSNGQTAERELATLEQELTSLQDEHARIVERMNDARRDRQASAAATDACAERVRTLREVVTRQRAIEAADPVVVACLTRAQAALVVADRRCQQANDALGLALARQRREHVDERDLDKLRDAQSERSTELRAVRLEVERLEALTLVPGSAPLPSAARDIPPVVALIDQLVGAA